MMRNGNQQRRRRGYTLVELAVVAAIVAVFAAIALPRMAGNLRNQRLNAAARRVVSDLSLAATRARTSSATRTVTFDLTAGTYTIPQETPLSKTSGSYSVSLAGDPYRVTLSDANFNSSTTATFDGYGKPASGGYVKVTVDGITRTVTLDDSGKAVMQ
jgi:prepilin-type N-terminal cleavage/methylation domain-containing protein